MNDLFFADTLDKFVIDELGNWFLAGLAFGC